LFQTDTLYNGTITYQPTQGVTGSDTGYDYCLISIVTILVNNLTETITSRDGIWLWNVYRNIAINQCNFSRTMDIGYGNCIPYYYENATSIQLCICSTNNCSATYSTCQTAVNQAISSPPPLLPVLQPTLSNTITCQDDAAIGYAMYNITPALYQGCYNNFTLGDPDVLKCSIYTPNHTVICAGLYDPMQDSYYFMAMIEGDYERLMYETIYYGAFSSNSSSGFYQYQTSTSIVSIVPDNSGQYNIAICLCTTNNCNVDFPTCTSGMNIPSYLLAYNESTSTISTGSTSSSATASSGSTTATTTMQSTISSLSSIITTLQPSTITTAGSTSSSSSSITTTLQSSTATSITISVSVSSTGIGNNNTSSTTTRSGSLSEKKFYSNFVLSLSVSLFQVSNQIDLSQLQYSPSSSLLFRQFKPKNCHF